jgi:phosphatidylglycerol lysyltransferase
MGNKPTFEKSKNRLQLETWGVRISALLTVLMGVINLISAIQPALMSRLALIEPFLPLEVRHGSRITSALAGFGLLLLAGNLWRRKRSAWAMTILLLAVTVLTHLIKGLDFEEASLGLGLLVLLFVLRHSFHAASDRPSVRQGLVVLAIAFGFTLVYGALGFALLDKHFKVHFGLWDALRQTIVMFTAFYNPGLEPLTGFGRYFAGSIYVIGLGTVGFAALMLLRPVLVRNPATVEERKRAKAIIEQHGRTALARAALFDDKSYFFGPGGSVITNAVSDQEVKAVGDRIDSARQAGETVVAYAARGQGAMALGDPIGPPEQVPDCIRLFRDFCARNDWTPAFVSTLPDYLDAYRAAGFDVICIGHEAIVALQGFTLEGSANKGVRYEVNHMLKLGYRAEVHLPPLDDRLLQSLHDISDAWLTLRHGGEMHFSDGWFDEDYLRNGPAIVVHAPEGSPIAFANLVTEYQKNELTIDLMRRYREVEHGTMEFLFTRMLQWAREQGYESFSLGLSALAAVGEKPDDPRVEQALHTISEYVSRFYNFKGLHDFKEKFHPRWEPRYLAYPGPASLPLVLATLLRVHSGSNFLWKFLRE